MPSSSSNAVVQQIEGPESGKMSEAKALFVASTGRKRAEQDSVLLDNRLKLLRAEEARARAKIAETEGKAAEIIEMRQRNLSLREKREAEEMAKKEKEEKIRRELVERKKQRGGKLKGIEIEKEEKRKEVRISYY